jgi:hypothetical protein
MTLREHNREICGMWQGLSFALSTPGHREILRSKIPRSYSCNARILRSNLTILATALSYYYPGDRHVLFRQLLLIHPSPTFIYLPEVTRLHGRIL